MLLLWVIQWKNKTGLTCIQHLIEGRQSKICELSRKKLQYESKYNTELYVSLSN